MWCKKCKIKCRKKIKRKCRINIEYIAGGINTFGAENVEKIVQKIKKYDAEQYKICCKKILNIVQKKM